MWLINHYELPSTIFLIAKSFFFVIIDDNKFRPSNPYSIYLERVRINYTGSNGYKTHELVYLSYLLIFMPLNSYIFYKNRSY